MFEGDKEFGGVGKYQSLDFQFNHVG